MFAKIRYSVFIDSLHLELSAPKGNCVRGVLKDDKGSVCRVIERSIVSDKELLIWRGLDELPYGHYTLELTHGNDEMKMDLVKRV